MVGQCLLSNVRFSAFTVTRWMHSCSQNFKFKMAATLSAFYSNWKIYFPQNAISNCYIFPAENGLWLIPRNESSTIFHLENSVKMRINSNLEVQYLLSENLLTKL